MLVADRCRAASGVKLPPLAGAALACALLAGCGTAGQSKQTPAFDGIAPADTIEAVGTEPFWNLRIADGELTYTTPENLDGTTIAVDRFAGNSGLAFSGTVDGAPLDLVVTRGMCSDGMSDRRYPFTATLRIAEEQREGCAWTERQPFSGPRAP